MAERRQGWARQADTTRAHYQGIRPFFDLRSPDIAIPPQLTEVYGEFLQMLSPDEAAIRIEMGENTFNVEPDLLKHMRQGDEIGRDWAEMLLEGTYGQLTPREQARVRANPALLVEKTVQAFQKAIEARKQ